MPLRPRHGYAAGFHRGLLAGNVIRSGVLWHCLQMRVTAQPISARFELVGGLRGFQMLVSHVHLSVLLAGHGSSGSADPLRRCQGCFPSNSSVPASPTALSFITTAATAFWWCPFTSTRF